MRVNVKLYLRHCRMMFSPGHVQRCHVSAGNYSISQPFLLSVVYFFLSFIITRELFYNFISPLVVN